MDEFGAAFHLNTALGQSTAENRFDVGLPDEQQMRKGRVGKVEVGEWHQDVAVSGCSSGGGRCVSMIQERVRHVGWPQNLQCTR